MFSMSWVDFMRVPCLPCHVFHGFQVEIFNKAVAFPAFHLPCLQTSSNQTHCSLDWSECFVKALIPATKHPSNGSYQGFICFIPGLFEDFRGGTSNWSSGKQGRHGKTRRVVPEQVSTNFPKLSPPASASVSLHCARQLKMQNMPCSQWSSAPWGWPHSWSDSSGWDFTIALLQHFESPCFACSACSSLWDFRWFKSRQRIGKLRLHCWRGLTWPDRQASQWMSPGHHWQKVFGKHLANPYIMRWCWTQAVDTKWQHWTNLFTNWMVNLSVRPIVRWIYD